MNLIQDMIDSGFEILEQNFDGWFEEEFHSHQISIYHGSFGIFYKSGRKRSTLSRIVFESDIDPWQYGDDYRMLNEEEIETFNILLKAVEL